MFVLFCLLVRMKSILQSTDNLFLCFPDTDLEYSSLELNEKLSVQKQIFHISPDFFKEKNINENNIIFIKN